mmetsp:Transcript_14125/g.23088  ORF Transcript_14125/g.23088 Transcript_14125/m.23088 type:complete len:406 (-) Transcript_14125:1387-2604(-)
MDFATAAAEVHECARYGELPELKEILELFPQIDVNGKDGHGSTALHKACANGHDDVVKFLLEKGAECMKNESGNSPLHWAIQNRQMETVKLLLATPTSKANVLEKNSDGKSSVTLAHDFDSAEMLKLVVEHKSFDRINRDGSVAKEGEKSDLQRDEEAQAAGKKEEQTMTSELEFGDGINVSIKEIGFLDADTDPSEDLKTTGAFLWAASLILSHWIISLKDTFAGKTVVELGAGCGLPGIVAHKYTASPKVVITDMMSATFDNLKQNVESNRDETKQELELAALNWCDKNSWPSSVVGQTDILIGSDLVYDLELVAPLVEVVLTLLVKSKDGVFYYVSADNNRAGCEEFVAALQKAGLDMQVHQVPEGYCDNPFKNKDENLFALRFPEFNGTSFKMYTFKNKHS